MDTSELVQIGTQRLNTGLKRLFHRFTLSFVAVIILMVALTGVASADSSTIKFSATADVTFIGLTFPSGNVVSTFFTKNNGEIKKVKIETFGEIIAGGGLVADCGGGERAEDFCSAIAGSAVLSIHDSSVSLDKITEIDGPCLVGALEGKIKGHLDSTFSIQASLVGTARLKINGSATYGCLAVVVDFSSGEPVFVRLAPEPLGVCQGLRIPTTVPTPLVLAAVILLPIELEVEDEGKFKIRSSTLTGFTDIKSVTGKVNVSLTTTPFTLVGTIAITKGKVKFEKD